MNASLTGGPQRVIYALTALFALGMTFSIALSQMSMLLTLVILTAYSVSTGDRPPWRYLNWFYVAAGAYVGWLLLACMAGGTFLHSLDNIREEWMLLIVPAGWFFLRETEHRDRLVGLIAVGLIITAGYTAVILSRYLEVGWDGGPRLVAHDLVRMRGSFSHSLTFGNLNAVAAVFVLAYALMRERVFSTWLGRLWVGGGFAGVLNTLMSNSRGPLLAVLGGLVLLLFLVRRRVLPVILAALVLMVGVVFSVEGISKRFSEKMEEHLTTDFAGGRRFIWDHTLMIIEDSPIFGVGPGNFGEAYKSKLTKPVGEIRHFKHAHNDVLNVAAVAGIPGGVIFLGLWLTVLGYLWLGYRRAGPGSDDRQVTAAALLASVVFLATSVTEATFSDEEPRALLMFIWAAGLTVWYKATESRPGH